MKNNRKKYLIIISLILVLIGSLFTGCSKTTSATSKSVTSSKTSEIIKPKVMILSMFEVDKNTGDLAGEFQHWYEGYFKNAKSINIKGAYSPVFYNKDGVCGTIIGQGKSHAAGSLSAILSNPKFDFSNTYFITSGCAGSAPSIGTLGSVFWSDYVVDYDLGHRWSPNDNKLDKHSFMAMDSYKDFTSFKLNKTLVTWAYNLSKDVKLDDCKEAQDYRKLYTEKEALKSPSVGIGTTICGDCFYHGKGLSDEAKYICKLYNTSAYSNTEMEDAAVALVLKNFGYLDHYLVSRDIVNFDQPHANQTIKESLDANSGGFSIGMTNGYKVASKVTNYIVSNWATWEKGVPELKTN